MEDNFGNLLELDWVKRALDPSTPTLDGKTIFTQSSEYEGKEILYPTIRMIDGELVDLGDKAMDYAIQKGDYVVFDTPQQAEAIAKMLSEAAGKVRETNKPLYDTKKDIF